MKSETPHGELWPTQTACGQRPKAAGETPALPNSTALLRRRRWRVLLCALAATTLRAADTNAVLEAWFAAQANVHTISADFVQTRQLKTLVQPLVATGHLWFSFPDEFRWELGQPAQTIALRQSDEMWVIYPRLKRAEHYPLGAAAPREWRDAMSILDAGFPRTRQEFDAQFQLQSLTETNHTWLLALQPRSPGARQFMPELQVNLATNNFSLVGTELVFVDGSRMRSDFTNITVNVPLDKSLFQWKPPADFTVTEPFAR
jgi:outer membrane lipoprotein carrier protein